ncbi:LTA synthase family protein [Furfurilactobacillus curtus]|uniref:Sulfatase n=1 Tax=Furfurilactobacillus curtus TaxID=1746200 RepID=A0ABQ5JSK0_9LACO
MQDYQFKRRTNTATINGLQPGLTILLATILILANWVIFGNNGRFLGPEVNQLTFHWLAAMGLRSVTLIGLPLLFISTGYFFSHNRPRLTIMQIWLLTLLNGVLLLFAYFRSTNSGSANLIYDVCLPILRHLYPGLLGVMIVLASQTWLVRLFKIAKRTSLIAAFWLILILPSLFNQDLFSFSNINSFAAGLLLTTVGLFLREAKLPSLKQSALVLVISLIGEIALNVAMGSISLLVHQDFSTAQRFLTATNPLIILATLATFTLAIRLSFQFATRFSRSTTVSPLFSLALGLFSYELTTRPVVTERFEQLIFQQLPAFSHHDLIWSGLLIILLLLAIAVISWLEVGILMLVQRSHQFRQLMMLRLNELLENTKHPYQFAKRHWQPIVVFVSLYFCSYFSIVIMNPNWTVTTWIVPDQAPAWPAIFFLRQSLIWLNLLFIYTIYSIIRALFNQYWTALVLTIGAMGLVITATLIKIQLRAEPILPSEVLMVSGYKDILTMVDQKIIIFAAIALVALIVLIWWLTRHVQTQSLSTSSRISRLIVGVMILISPIQFNHVSSIPGQFVKTMGDDPSFYSQTIRAQINGPVIQFLNNIDVKIMAKPADYSKQTMTRLVHRYQHQARQINRTRTTDISKQTVIFNLSESFSDPRRVPQLKVNHNPLPFISSIKHDTTAGLMMSSGYGGGTANMEYQTLTGLSITNFSPTLPTPYTQLVPNAAYTPAFNNLFPYSMGIHPYTGNLYDRITVYKKFGFNQFDYLGSSSPITNQHHVGTNPYLSDQTAYQNTLRQLKHHVNGQFINLVTMQNHMPFDNYYAHNQFKVTGQAFASETSQRSIENYAKGISISDQQVKKFIKQLDQIDRPITLVWYGDHLPGIYDGLSMRKDGQALHETDYFVYSNRYARAHGAKQKVNQPIVAPYSFPALVLKQLNAKVSPYYALQTDLLEQLPAMSTSSKEGSVNNFNAATEYTDSTGHPIHAHQLSSKKLQLLHDYQLVQYDITAGHHYVKSQHFMK